MISKINQSAEKITIKANKIILEGLVTINNNFKVLSDGSIEAKNAKFSGNITGSNISGGTITGSTITGGIINEWHVSYSSCMFS